MLDLLSSFITIAHAYAATETPSGIAALGVDVKSLMFQIVNFTILLFVLHKFAYRPILKILDERRQKIEESLKTAQKIEAMRIELAKTQQEIIQDAYTRAQKILEDSQTQARDIVKDAETKALQRAQQILAEAQADIDRQLAAAKADLQKEMLTLVGLATERIIKQKLDEQKDETLIRAALQEVLAQHEPAGAKV